MRSRGVPLDKPSGRNQQSRDESGPRNRKEGREAMTDGVIEGAFYAEMGKKLWCKRTERGWSRAALAKEVGCHRNTIERWEAANWLWARGS